MKNITVKASTTYNVTVADGILNKCGEIIKKVTDANKIALVTDDIVDTLYSQTVLRSLSESGFSVCKFAFKNGENSKNLKTLNDIYNFLIENQITRTDGIAALGGGVVGDITGFAAATYLRGVDFFQIPTTLLAQVDSSVGGKTAIDMPGGKNLVGAFKQPKAVICDLTALNTLSADIFADGMGEAIKYGMIKDHSLFDLFLNGSWDEQKENVISRCIEIKRDVVETDEFENGERMLLNFGHTLGHAIEKTYNYTGISHGKSVAIGMSLITGAAARSGICSQETYELLVSCLKKWKLPYETDIPLNTLLEYSMSDKKRSADFIKIVLCSEIGKSFCKKLSIHEFGDFLNNNV